MDRKLLQVTFQNHTRNSEIRKTTQIKDISLKAQGIKADGRTCNQAKSQPLTHAARRWTDDMEKKVKTYRPEERGIGITGRKSLC